MSDTTVRAFLRRLAAGTLDEPFTPAEVDIVLAELETSTREIADLRAKLAMYERLYGPLPRHFPECDSVVYPGLENCDCTRDYQPPAAPTEEANATGE